MSARVVAKEFVALLAEARISQGLGRDAVAHRLGWPLTRLDRVEDPVAVEALDFGDVLDLIEAVGLDPGEVTEWLVARYGAERKRCREDRR